MLLYFGRIIFHTFKLSSSNHQFSTGIVQSLTSTTASIELLNHPSNSISYFIRAVYSILHDNDARSMKNTN